MVLEQAAVEPLIPTRMNLKHMDGFKDECRIIYLFGILFEPAIRTLVQEIEKLMTENKNPDRLLAARKELEARRWELFSAVRHYLKSFSVGRAQIELPDGTIPKPPQSGWFWTGCKWFLPQRWFSVPSIEPGYFTIGKWISSLPAAIFPSVNDELLRKMGLKAATRQAGFAAFNTLMGSAKTGS